jgi:hypothetical protein
MMGERQRDRETERQRDRETERFLYDDTPGRIFWQGSGSLLQGNRRLHPCFMTPLAQLTAYASSLRPLIEDEADRREVAAVDFCTQYTADLATWLGTVDLVHCLTLAVEQKTEACILHYPASQEPASPMSTLVSGVGRNSEAQLMMNSFLSTAVGSVLVTQEICVCGPSATKLTRCYRRGLGMWVPRSRLDGGHFPRHFEGRCAQWQLTHVPWEVQEVETWSGDPPSFGLL